MIPGFGNLMQDVLWCFSQVKGTIDIGVTEGMEPELLRNEMLFSLPALHLQTSEHHPLLQLPHRSRPSVSSCLL
ncbi:unnamed protein product [Caretta caretta]